MRVSVRSKAMLGVLVPITAILTLFAYLTYAAHRDVMLVLSAHTVAELGRMVEGGIQQAMARGDQAAVGPMIAALVTDTDVHSVMLLDAGGTVRQATDPAQLGRAYDLTDPGCAACHAPGGARPEIGTALVTLAGTGRLLRNCRPIPNRPECQACHDPSQAINGVLLTDVHLGPVDQALADYARAALLALVAAVALGGGAAWLTMDRLVVRRLEALTVVARRVARGEPGGPPPSGPADELGELAGALGVAGAAMAERARLEARLQERAVALEQLNAALAEKERDRTRLLRSTIEAQEAERRRVARQLHDALAQALTGLILGLDAAEPRLAGQDAPLAAQLARTRAVAGEALDQTRRLILDLRPSMLDDLGLAAAIRWFAEDRLAGSGAAVLFASEGSARRLEGAVETALFRIAQEAIHNVARHAEARHVGIRLAWEPETLTLSVSDDGRGFDPAALRRDDASGAGLGLLGLAERTEIIGGRLQIDSHPGQGTRVTVLVPLPPEA